MTRIGHFSRIGQRSLWRPAAPRGTLSPDPCCGGQGLGKLLSTIDEPAALRVLCESDLARLADELRSELIEIGAQAGGHFAGSLGTVELTIALHTVFETPGDAVVWDVGHQAYGHKILTGRREALRRVKQADGPAGFLRRAENPYDVFGAGHAGTSVSAAVGMAEAAARLGSGRQVVAVIGDGAATAGMSFEALNHAGHLRSNVRVVFNDNGMSIAPNVGGLRRTGDARGYFEALGMQYQGPVDGHDLAVLLPALRELRCASGPTVLHVKTRKGNGFAPAEADPFKWHATGRFDPETGERSPAVKKPTWTSAFADALADLADRDPRIVAITAAMPDGTGLERFAERHPDRVYDVGIAEQHAVTFAAGLAVDGMRPVCAIYSSFLQRAFDQIVHDVALQGLPVAFAIDRAGLVGADGPTHHGMLDLAYLRIIPGLVVAAPRNENELRRQLATAFECDGPFAVRFPRGASPCRPIDPDPKALPIGRGELLRDGRDLGVIAVGKTVAPALAAAERLSASGIEAGVFDARFIKPLDISAIARIADRTGALLTVEDHALAGGLGAAVLEELGERTAGVRIRRLGIGDVFVDHATQEAQARGLGIDQQGIERAARSLVRGVAPHEEP